MTKSQKKTSAAPSVSLDSWLLSSASVGSDALSVLAAYRTAAESLRQAGSPKEAVPIEAGESDVDSALPDEVPSRGLPLVPRLRRVEGVDDAELAAAHGQLLASGYLTAEVLGRSDGLAYRITRDGVRQLNGDAVTADAA